MDISTSELIYIINEWINGKNAERNRKIIKRRLIDGICYEPLAEEFDMSVRQTKRICKDCMQILIKHIDKDRL